MAEVKRTKKKKRVQPRKRYERRFVGGQTQTTRYALVAGMLGALVLGAGVYALWIREAALPYGPYLVAGGAAVLALGLWFGDSAASPVRVGDAGVAKEKGSELLRLLWCDIDRIFVSKDRLVLRSPETTLEVPLSAQRTAAAWILKEAARRVPEALDVKRSVVDDLPAAQDSDGELLVIDAFQVAGRHCAATDKPISFERDARLCPNCAQVYLKDHVPKRCTTCNAVLTDRAYRPTG
jgi:hypothetical protein